MNMHALNNIFLRMALAALPALTALILATGTAQASYYPGYNISTLESYLNGQNGNQAASYEVYTGNLGGLYKVTALAYEAGHNNVFYGSASGSVLFSNQVTSDFGTYASGVDLTQAYYQDISDNEIYDLSSDNVRIYRLTADWTVPGLGTTLAAGTLIIGLNDSWTGDGDYDDLILAARHTPIPGAVWLLGTGLLGLVSIRQVLNKH